MWLDGKQYECAVGSASVLIAAYRALSLGSPDGSLGNRNKYL